MAIKLFGKWEWNVVVRDPSLAPYINLRPTFVAHESEGRHSKDRFGRASVNIVERLMNRLMHTGHVRVRKKGSVKTIVDKKHRLSSKQVGNKMLAYKIVKKAFDLIYERTKENPIQVLVRAIEYAGPIEETVSVQIGGIITPISVDTSPQRRVDLALKYICNAARAKAFVKRRPIHETLAEEIIAAAENNSDKSLAIAKKIEVERMSRASKT